MSDLDKSLKSCSDALSVLADAGGKASDDQVTEALEKLHNFEKLACKIAQEAKVSFLEKKNQKG